MRRHFYFMLILAAASVIAVPAPASAIEFLDRIVAERPVEIVIGDTSKGP